MGHSGGPPSSQAPIAMRLLRNAEQYYLDLHLCAHIVPIVILHYCLAGEICIAP